MKIVKTASSAAESVEEAVKKQAVKGEMPFRMAESALREAIRSYSTPLYIFHEDEFLSRFDYFRQYLGDDIGLTFCMKTNPFLTGVSLAKAERIEVCSFGEFQLCKDIRIPPERLLISGVLKQESDLREIIRYAGDRALYTAESKSQFQLLDQIGREEGIRLSVLLRLSSGNQFGMDEATILHLVRRKVKFPNTEISGIHYFSGTQKHRLAKHQKELEKLDNFFRRLQTEADYHVPMLEYGTGFGVPYFDGQEENVTSPASLREFRDMLNAMKWKGKVTLEMGRALAYSCGIYITEVCDTKSNDGKNYIIVDGGIHQLQYDGQIRGMYQPDLLILPGVCVQGTVFSEPHSPVLPPPKESPSPKAYDEENPPHSPVLPPLKESAFHSPPIPKEAQPLPDPKKRTGNAETSPDSGETHYVVCGSLCTTNDVLIADYAGSEIHNGDYLIFGRTGAYSIYEGMSLFLSHELPGVVLYSERDGFSKMRVRQETYPLNTPMCGIREEYESREMGALEEVDLQRKQ